MSATHSRIGANIPFTRVPAELLSCDWVPLLAGRWEWAEHITLGEGRAVIKLLSMLAQDPRAHRHRVLSLQDNRPVAGSFAKGRASSEALNRLCRKRAAISIAAEIYMLLPWVQSGVMPADWLSRLQDDAEPSQPRLAPQG